MRRRRRRGNGEGADADGTVEGRRRRSATSPSGISEDAETAPRGGDLGLVPVSRLKQLPPALRDAVLNKEPGSVNVASVGGGHTLVLVVAHEPAGQRDLNTQGVRERITDALRGRKEQLLRAAYLTAARSDAESSTIWRAGWSSRTARRRTSCPRPPGQSRRGPDLAV